MAPRSKVYPRMAAVLSAVAMLTERTGPLVQARDIARWWRDDTTLSRRENPDALTNLSDNQVREALDLLVAEGSLDTLKVGAFRYYALPHRDRRTG